MAIDSAAEINSELTQPVQQPKKEGPLQSFLKVIGIHPKDNLTTPAQPAAPTTEAQIAAHQADIQTSENNIKMMSGMDPRPQDRPLIDAEQARIKAAQEAISNLQQPTPPTPETPPGITQIPVAQPLGESNPMPTVQTPPAEEQKAA